MVYPLLMPVFSMCSVQGEVQWKYRNVIPNFMYWAMKNQALPITGDGSETRDWTYVDDIVNGLMAMGIVEEAVGEAINLGSATETRVIDMANMVNGLTGNEGELPMQPEGVGMPRLDYYLLLRKPGMFWNKIQRRLEKDLSMVY